MNTTRRLRPTDRASRPAADRFAFRTHATRAERGRLSWFTGGPSAGQVSALALCVGLGLVTVSAGPASGQTVPTGGSVVSGSATITQPGSGQLTVRQTTDRGIINWQTFSVGAGGKVDFQQPSSTSATLNRVGGGMTSVIAGQITANGQVFLVNPNGIQITPTGSIRTGAFVASTLDIRNDDFLAGRSVFQGNGASAAVINQGTIEAATGGSVVLLGGRVTNDGTIIAHGGRVGLASAERVVVDLQGDGFLQVSVPTADAERTEALIKHTGRIQANGGRVEMRAATTADVARAAINISGTIEARTVMRTDAGVIFGTEVGAPAPTTAAVVQRGRVVIDGGPGGAVVSTGRITAGSGTQRGGDISIVGSSIAAGGTLDVSGGTSGGTISVDGGSRLDVTGTWTADGGTNGGRIDVTADDLRLTSAMLSATGGDVGGLIRIGGAFQGGSVKDGNSPELQSTFVTRWADAPDMRNATETRVGSSATIDVSGGNVGGTAIVWANGTTWMNGAVKATGLLSAGSVEISGKENLAFVDLTKLELGSGGHVLLDPKFIVIDTTGASSSTSGNNEFGDNAAGTNSIAVASLLALLNADTAVELQANTDINVNVGWTASSSGSSGNLTLRAGRSVIFASGITINTDGGNFTVTANDSGTTSNRDAGAATLNMAGLTLNAGSGAVTLTMGTESTGGDIRLGTITSDQSINVTFTSAATVGNVELNGNITSGNDVNLPDRNIVVRANSVLTSGGGGSDDVNWSGESTGKTITGVVGGETVRFVEGSTVTRIGVMDTANAARLAIGQTSATRPYGDANPDVGVPSLTSGSLRGADTLASLLVAGSTTVNYSGGTPTPTTNVGGRNYTVSDTASTAFAAGKVGYFLNTDTVNGTLTITARPITVTADAKSKVYGDADPALTFTTSSLGGGAAVNGSLARTAGETVAGSPYNITQGTVTNGNNSNYSITFVGANFTITARPITVTAAAKTKVYGDADPALTFTTSSLGTGTAVTGALARTAGETVAGSPYAITQGTVTNANNPNYTITFVGANFTITARPITVTAAAKTKVYGDADPALTFTTSSLGTGTAVTGALARNAGETVAGSPYAITQGTVTNANNPNYTITFVGANFTITKRPITVTADATSKVYGDADPALTFTTSSLGTGVAVTGALARSAGETVAGSPYNVTQGTVTNANNPNYTITYVGANFTITKRPITVTADAKSKVYGNADPALTFTTSSLGTGTAVTGALARNAGETVAGSPYAITQGTVTNANNPNYTITYVGANFTITPAPLNVVADGKTKVYGDADPALTFAATGFKFSDTAGTALTGSLSRTAGETVAGSPYAINVGTLAGANYTINFTSANFTITARPITVTAAAQSKVYGDADPALTFTTSSLGTGTAVSGALARNAGETVAGGPYAITQGTVTNANNPNYTITFVGANFTITARPITVTADAKSKVYGDADPALTFTTSSLGTGTAVTGALARNAGETVAGGPYAITQGTVTNANNPNYTITYVGANLAITAAPLNVVADAKSKVFGDADPALTFAATGFKFADTSGTVLTGALARAAGETVAGSPYAINQGTLAANTNYTIAFTGANLTITQATLNVVADAKTKVYGDADPALTFAASGFKGGDTSGTVLTGGLARAAGETVAGGPYAINQGTLAANANYTIVYTGAFLTITRAPLNVVADGKTKIYGDADPALTFAATGFKFGETAAVLTGGLSRAAGETVATSPYAITQGTLAGANYTIAYTGANLAITPAPLNVVADGKTKVYGDADPALTFAATGFKFADTTGTVLTGALARAAGENVATSPYAIGQGTLAANANYAIAYTGANLTITPAPLNVVADAKSKVFGDADPALTFAATGFKFADTSGTVLTGALARAAGETVAGSPYAIGQGTLAANTNYAIAFTGANLTITQATLNVVADAKSKIYGDADPALTFVASGFKGGDTSGTVLTGGLARAAGETVAGGPYAINQGTLAANANYTIVYTGAFLTITRAPLNVVADGKTKVYGDADPALTFAATGFKFGETAAVLTGGLSRAAGETVATSPYAITQGTLAGANYTIAYTGANLAITPAPLNVVADGKTKVYGDGDPALTFAATGFKFADTTGTVLTGALARAAGETVAGGPYAIGQGTLAANANYAIAYTGANLTITPATLNVVADGKTKIYGNADPALTFVATGFKLADTTGTVLTGVLARAPGETVAGGPYAIGQGTLAANTNYAIAYTGATLAITARPITVTADDKTKIELTPDPALTWTVTAGSVAFGDVPTGGLVRDPGETVGPYAIRQGTLAFGGNYALSFVDGVLTIQPQPSGPLPPINIVGSGGPGSGGNGPLAGLYSGGPAGGTATLGDVPDSGTPEQQQNLSCKINGQGTLICGAI